MESKLKFAQMDQAGETPTFAAPAAPAEQFPKAVFQPAEKDADPMPKRTAFLAWCKVRGLDADTDKDGWGRLKFKHSHIEAMWEGWFNAPSAAPVAVGSTGDAQAETIWQYEYLGDADGWTTVYSDDEPPPGEFRRNIKKFTSAAHIDSLIAHSKGAEGSVDTPPAPAEPCAVIGDGWRIFYVNGSLVDIVNKHGLKIGSALYAAPPAAKARLTEWISVADRLPEVGTLV